MKAWQGLVAAGALVASVTACGGVGGSPQPVPRSSTTVISYGQVACTDSLETEIDQAAPSARTSSLAVPIPSDCAGLSHAQVQTIANEIADDYSQARAFANTFASSMP